jgi:hypothetical protein
MLKMPAFRLYCGANRDRLNIALSPTGGDLQARIVASEIADQETELR